MITAILPDLENSIKPLTSDRMDDPPDRGGFIVIRLGLDGILTTQIIADSSTEEDTLRRRLTTAEPLLDVLRRLFIVEHPVGLTR